ncbi:tetratricopeptide repeat protein [candidate division WOR-3 bacterium]|nr:tetratricopeptide repeat protein [candidate division WOR-3 bacterium]
MRRMTIVVTVMLILAGCASQEMTSGKIYMQQENWDRAIEFFSKEVETNPANAEAHMWLGRAHAQKREYEVAADNFNKAIKIDPDIVKEEERLFIWGVYNAAGEKAANRNDFIKAISYFTYSIEIEPDSAITYTFLAYAYSEMQDTSNAIKNYSIAIEKDPSNADKRSKLAIYYMSLKNYEEAVKEFTEATSIDPLNIDALYHTGVCYTYLEDLDNAENTFRKVIEIDSTNEDAYFNLAMTLIQKKDIENAKTTLIKALEINPEDVEALSFLGSIYLQEKKYKESIDAYTRAIELRPEDPVFYYNRASAYFGLDETKKQKADEAMAKRVEKGIGIVNVKISGSAGLTFSGHIGNIGKSRSVEGSVPEEYFIVLENELDVATVVFQKEQEEGTLVVEMIIQDEVVKSVSTSAAFGTVTVTYSASQ